MNSNLKRATANAKFCRYQGGCATCRRLLKEAQGAGNGA